MYRVLSLRVYFLAVTSALFCLASCSAGPPAAESSVSDEFADEAVRVIVPAIGEVSREEPDSEVAVLTGTGSFRCCFGTNCIIATSAEQCRAHRYREHEKATLVKGGPTQVELVKLNSRAVSPSVSSKAALIATLSRCVAQNFGYRPDKLSGEHFICDVNIERTCDGSGTDDILPRRIIFRGVTSARSGGVSFIEKPTDGETYRIIVSERIAEDANVTFDVLQTTECPK